MIASACEPQKPPGPPPPRPLNCKWGKWTWQACDSTCGEGTQIGSRRIIQQALNGGKKCSGPSRTSRPYNTELCPGLTPLSVINYKYLMINFLHFLQLLKIVSGVNGTGKIALGQHVEQEDRVATGLSFNMPLMEVKRALEDQRLLGCVTHPCKPRQRWRM